MKFTNILLLLALGTAFINAQSWVSSNIITSDADINIISSTADADNSTLVMGFFTGTIGTNVGSDLSSYGGRDYFIAKFTSQNEIQWIHQFGSNANDFVTGGVTTDANNNVYVIGGFQSTLNFTPTESMESSGAFDIFFAKLDVDGNVLWCNNIGKGNADQLPRSIKVDNYGDIIISGYFSDSIQLDADVTLYSENVYNDYFYGKFNPNSGILIWAKQIKSINNNSSGQILGTAPSGNAYTFVGMYKDSIVFDSEDTIVSENNSLDIFILNTDLQGNINWLRSIKGESDEYAYSITSDPTGALYFSGYYSSLSLTADINNSETTTIENNAGDYDIFISKYSADGTFQWLKTNGGIGNDRIYRMNYYDDEIHVIGLFSDVFLWGGINLSTNGVNDQDMFYGSLSLDGNYRNANSFKGRNNSTEEGRAIFAGIDRLSTVIRSNSDLLVLGDSIYTNPSLKYFVAVGNIGCLPINITTSKTDVTSCYGDETGSAFIAASGGFGGPFLYSIDNGETYQNNDPNFLNLPAGVYQTVVVDNSNCAEPGPEITIIEPDTLMITNVVSEDALCNGENGSITVEANGGTGTLFFSTDNGITYPHTIGTAANLPEGVYNIMVKDASNCTTAGPADTISQPESALQITLVSQSDITNETDGQIVVSANGGTTPYTYTLQPAGVTQATGVFTFAAGEGGDYVVEVDDANSCGPVSTSTITITDFTNVNDRNHLSASIYPNPSSGMVTVEFSTDKQEMTLEVFSIDGRNVMSRQVYSSGGQVKEILDLSSLDKGMYMLRVDQQTLSSGVVLK